MDVRFINPFVNATQTLFQSMLEFPLTRKPLTLFSPKSLYDGISGIVHLRGAARGTVVLHFSRNLAIQVTRTLWQEEQKQVDERVRDAVGEMTNMVVGQVRSELDQLNLQMSLPVVKHERFHATPFPPNSQPIRIPFETQFGPLAVDISFVEMAAEQKRQQIQERISKVSQPHFNTAASMEMAPS